MTLVKDPEGTETQFLHQYYDFAGKRMLEIGCGDGRLTWRYAAFARQVVGVDPDAEALRTALKDHSPGGMENTRFARANSLHLPFPHETFDLAILAWSL